MIQTPRQFSRPKPRPKAKARLVTLSDAEKAKYDALAKERAERDKIYGRHVPIDSPKR